MQTTSDIWETLYTQRAIRAWKTDPVPEELIWKVIEAGTKAPSGTNTQPWGFVVIQDDAIRQAISDQLHEGLKGNEGLQQMLEQRSQSADKTTRLMLKGAQRLFTNLASAPVFIIPCLYQVSSPAPEGLLSGSSIYGAVQNMLLAARALGLGTVMTTFQMAAEQILREQCNLPDDATPVALIPMGYPDAKFGPTTRKPVETVTHWEQWGTNKERVD
ncbi:MAG: nitroreductase family protein [Dehalococcoidia bacterium]|nr:nitroreductase family protein [Dehalococcoidia bacterium]